MQQDEMKAITLHVSGLRVMNCGTLVVPKFGEPVSAILDDGDGRPITVRFTIENVAQVEPISVMPDISARLITVRFPMVPSHDGTLSAPQPMPLATMWGKEMSLAMAVTQIGRGPNSSALIHYTFLLQEGA